MAEENAEELLEVGEDQMDAMAEPGLDSAETTLLGLGGAVAGAGVYQGAKALSSDTCGNSEHVPHVAYVKLKLMVCFQFLYLFALLFQQLAYMCSFGCSTAMPFLVSFRADAPLSPLRTLYYALSLSRYLCYVTYVYCSCRSRFDSSLILTADGL